MTARDFKTQVFKTQDQWNSGLFYRLDTEKGKGFTIYSVPTFAKWIKEPNGKYLFCWDRIPGEDTNLLIDFLIQNFSINWIRTAEIERINTNKIQLSYGNKLVLLQLKNENTIVQLTISDGGQYELTLKKENGKLNVYAMVNPVGLAFDDCGQIFFIDATTCRLYMYDPSSAITRFEIVSKIGGCGSDIGKFREPTKILLDKFTLWVFDAGNCRIIAYSRDNYQIKYCITGNLNNPVNLILDQNGDIYILNKKSDNEFKIFKYNNNGIEKDFEVPCSKELKVPVDLAIGKDNTLHIIDKKCEQESTYESTTCIHKISEEGKCLKPLMNLRIPVEGNETRDFIPSFITIDRKGNMFIAEDNTGFIHQFDSHGSFIGTIQIPDFKGNITGITMDHKGDLYAGCNKGIAFFKANELFSKEQGFYYSKTLDNGNENRQWHRLLLEGKIPPKTNIEVWYYSSDDSTKKRRIDTILSDPEKPIDEKKESLENEIHTWIGPEILSHKIIKENADKVNEEKGTEAEKTRLDMLFREKTGRYLWLKIGVSTFSEEVRPAITQMKVLYPRISYLRYLPAIYQENPISKEFLDRFLSIFETVFYDLETTINDISKYFDPDTVTDKPQDFLSWLAFWLNIAIEEDWNEDLKRTFIREAARLYKLKGTPEGIETIIEIYTGKKPLLLEHSKIGKPMVLTEEGTFTLGVNSLLLKTPVRGFKLGEDSILGLTALIDSDPSKASTDPFLLLAHRFTIILDLPATDYSHHEKTLKRILDRVKPAHTMYYLRKAGEMEGISGLQVGINTKVVDQSHFSLGDTSIIGSGVLSISGESGGKVERHSKLEIDTELK